MRSEVMYRDLPGGPLLVKFADEIPLWCICTKCGMLSNDMFEDSASHVFCSVCIFECSEQKKIHCKHERKDVPVDDMVQAVDIGRIMMDQIVFCPNSKDGNGCVEFCALKDLKGHYLECAGTEINCLSCGNVVKGLDWGHHIISCPQEILQCRYCALAVPRCGIQAHEQLCYDNPDATYKQKAIIPVLESRNSCSEPLPREESKASFDITEGKSAPVIETQPFHNVLDSDNSLSQCIYCKRYAKRKNMELHLKKCAENKASFATSTVSKLSGEVEITPDYRSTPILGPNDPTLETTTSQNSLTSCVSHSAQEAQPASSFFPYGGPIASALGYVTHLITEGAELLVTVCWPEVTTAQMLQDSDIAPM